MSTNKKVTHVGGNEDNDSNQEKREKTSFTPTSEAKGRAKQFRMFSVLLWILGIAAQVWAISLLFKQPLTMWLIIVLIVVDLALVVTGSMLWKKSNRLDPPSNQRKLLFFMQSQLGMFTAVVAFLPLVIFILTSKNIDGKQKAILGGIAGLALVIAGISGYDFNPPSIEEYTNQTNQVEELTDGQNLVYWTESGTRYHLSDSCSYINTDRTDEIFSGSVAQARELKNITELCSLCKSRAEKANQPIEVEENMIDKGVEQLEELVTE